MTKSIFTGIAVLVALSTPVQAEVYGYTSWWPNKARETLARASAVYDRIPVSNACMNQYSHWLNKDTIDVRYALGYFDESTGKPIGFLGAHGLSPSLDPEVHASLQLVLTRPCRGSLDVVCGFRASGSVNSGMTVYTKRFQFMGRPKNLRITMTHASASAKYQVNIQPSNQRQTALTLRSEANYFDGLSSADVIFYNGHSRNGGGPDFKPVRLNSLLKPDYAWYQRVTPGLNRMIEQIKTRGNNNAVVGMFSCYSHKNFAGRFRSELPGQATILSTGTIDYSDAFRASLIYLEGVLRGHCGSSLQAGANSDGKVSGTFNIFGGR